MAGEASIGTCYGFAVRSDLPFQYLRSGDGPPLTVSAPAEVDEAEAGPVVLEWSPSARFPLHGRLHRHDGGFRLWIETWGWFTIDPESRRVAVPETPDVLRREERLWSVPAMLCFLARGDTPLHAAAVEVDGGAIVLAAPGTFGKTTLAAAFHVAGHRLLSEDTACVRTDGPPSVVPGPAMLRLRPDMAARLDVPRATLLSEREDRVHMAVDPGFRGDCAPVPLRAIVMLRGEADHIELERAAPQDAIRNLFALSFQLPTDAERVRTFTAATELVRSVPVWNLRRPVTVEDLPAAVEELARRA